MVPLAFFFVLKLKANRLRTASGNSQTIVSLMGQTVPIIG
jgi:hypothetical protein